MKKNFIRNAHRWLGLIFSLSILLSSGSGVLHNLMTYTQKPPPPVCPSGEGISVEKIAVPINEVPTRLGWSTVQSINVRNLAGEPWYQAFTASVEKPGYVNAVDGRVDPTADERYAAQIAAHFLGGAAVRQTDYLTEFNGEYINIFRVLPVYRFDGDDELHSRVYVSSVTGSVTRYTDDKRQFEANIFTTFHKFGFIPNKFARDVILSTLTLGAFVVSILGIILFFATSPMFSSRSTRKKLEE